jgi:hypothetical protein
MNEHIITKRFDLGDGRMIEIETDKLHPAQGLQQMRFAAGEETGVAGGGEELFAAGA